jgi:uncharacterized protein
MKHLPIALVLCLSSATVCPAQQTDADQPATKTDIDRYYDAVHIREMMKSMMDAVSKQARQLALEQVLKTPGLPPDAEHQVDQLLDTMLKQMPIDDLLDAMEPVYAKHFTKGDIDAMIAFYSTPAGKKALAEMPTITQEAMQASSGVLRKYMDRTMQDVQDQIAQMQRSSQPDPHKAVSRN